LFKLPHKWQQELGYYARVFSSARLPYSKCRESVSLQRAWWPWLPVELVSIHIIPPCLQQLVTVHHCLNRSSPPLFPQKIDCSGGDGTPGNMSCELPLLAIDASGSGNSSTSGASFFDADANTTAQVVTWLGEIQMSREPWRCYLVFDTWKTSGMQYTLLLFECPSCCSHEFRRLLGLRN
jgi:hypothetical protein